MHYTKSERRLLNRIRRIYRKWAEERQRWREQRAALRRTLVRYQPQAETR
jgi:hypothetical protein